MDWSCRYNRAGERLGENYPSFIWKLLKVIGLQFSCALSPWYLRCCSSCLWVQSQPTTAESLLACHTATGNCCHFTKKGNYFLTVNPTLADKLTHIWTHPCLPPPQSGGWETALLVPHGSHPPPSTRLTKPSSGPLWSPGHSCPWMLELHVALVAIVPQCWKTRSGWKLSLLLCYISSLVITNSSILSHLSYFKSRLTL